VNITNEEDQRGRTLRKRHTGERLAMEAANLLSPHLMRLKINTTIMEFPPVTLPDEPARRYAYIFVSAETSAKDDWAVTQVRRILDRHGFLTEQYGAREIKILGRAKA